MTALVLGAGPAFAVGVANDGDARGHVHVGGSYIAVCDDWADNHGVYAEYLWATSTRYGDDTISDHDGAGGNCGTTTAPGDIYEVRFCVRKENSMDTWYCRDWVWVG